MTHFQELFIKNLRFFRKKRGLSQLKLSETINISPNYLNALENGRNFPSPEVIQAMADALEVLPYQFFLEQPQGPPVHKREASLIQELAVMKQRFNAYIDGVISRYGM
jgi:transcriptional regulator with XRE-family HTH domain